jgi:protocatechuate 3,4-dioxygenase beta subunit
MRTPATRCGAIARLVIGAMWAVAASAAGGQVVRGSVTDISRRPTPGVVVLLVDSTTQVAARALSDERGSFRLAAPRPGTYQIRTLRIGYRPVLSDHFALGAGNEVTRDLVITDLPISLDTMRVVDRNVCRAFTDSGAATFAVWEQIRTALTAAQLTAASRTIATTTVNYERRFGARPGINEGKLLQRSAVVFTGYVTQPWSAIPADSLRRAGYVVTQRDGSLDYYAPDLDVLLSPTFVEGHCFRLVRDRSHKNDLGIAFAPVPDRRRVADIRGTLWIDRSTSELRGLDFDYANVPAEQTGRAGGDLRFVHLRDGTWAISEWEIRMPLLEQTIIPGHAAEIRMTELHATGGQLALARREADTLWTGRRLVVAGNVVDSSSGNAIAGARVQLAGTSFAETTDARGKFSFDSVLPGNYTFDVHTPSLDSLSISRRVPVSLAEPGVEVEVRLPDAGQVVRSLCAAYDRADPQRDLQGIVLGRANLRAANGQDSLAGHALSNLKIIAEWRDAAAETATNASDNSSVATHRVETRTASDGSFRFCRLPTTTSVSLQAAADGAETGAPQIVQFAPGTRLARAELTLDPQSALVARGAEFTGIVVSDSTHVPIAGAEVALPDLGKSALTDTAGRFRLMGIPAGDQRVQVRRLGYGAADTKVSFRAGETVERRVVLGRAVLLEPVTVSERELDRRMASFEENRRVGLGHFMTRAEIAKYDGMTITSALSQLGSAVRVLGNQSIWVTSNRAPRPPCGPGDTACFESHGWWARPGAPIACYSLVYLDKVLMNGAHEPTEPFDLRTIAPERVQAMEFYAGPSETPLEYSRMASDCGVLVIWTRY